jgi:MFS family permease
MLSPRPLMSELLQSIQNMPLAGVVPAFVLLIAGLVLWLAGRRVLRGAFVLIGLLLGALVGLLVDDVAGTGMPGWVVPTLCAVILAVFAAITYRLAAAVMLALALGLACPMCVIAVNDWQVERGHGVSTEGDEDIVVDDSISDWIDKHDDPESREKAKAAIEKAKADVSQRIGEVATRYGLEEEAAAGIEKAKSIGRAIADTIIAQWNSAPKRLKPIVSLSTIVGALCGLIIGLVARRLGDCAVTAMVGAALWIGSAQVIALRLDAPDGPWMLNSTTVWLGVWLIAAIIGLAVQWTRKPAPADKPA